ncbi:MAG: hypothetical protein ACJAR2_002609 [Ilumatobacter sp.]|jgi:hypothetical protein
MSPDTVAFEDARVRRRSRSKTLAFNASFAPSLNQLRVRRTTPATDHERVRARALLALAGFFDLVFAHRSGLTITPLGQPRLANAQPVRPPDAPYRRIACST